MIVAMHGIQMDDAPPGGAIGFVRVKWASGGRHSYSCIACGVKTSPHNVQRSPASSTYKK